MDEQLLIELGKALPFNSSGPSKLSQLFQTKRSQVFEKLKANNCNKNMLKLVNGFSKNNYTCGYYEEENINNSSTKHLPEGLKAFQLNIENFSNNGSELTP